jgi:predicted dehydrogenase
MTTTRRGFIRTASLLTAGSILHREMPAKDGIVVTPSDKINVGLIGANSMGWYDLLSFLKIPGVECAALCDIDGNVRNKRTDELVRKGRPRPKLYNDYRKMLENKDIDVVIIGTPDHWHCLMLCNALEAGKNIYVEKPLANSIAEINIMQMAVSRHKKMVQVGQWQRSQPHFATAIDYLASGKLGRVRLCKTWSFLSWKGTLPRVPDSPVPEGVDYDAWLGPSPKRPFNKNHFHFNWRWYWEHAGGLMTDWGVHLIDYVLLGMKRRMPLSVASTGGKYAFPDDDMVTPDTMTTIFDFKDFMLTWEQSIGIGLGNWKRDHGIAFTGENGTLVLDRGGWEVIPERDKAEAIPFKKNEGTGLDLHVKNFIDSLRNNTPGRLNAELNAVANVSMVAHAGNIAYRTGEKIYWNNDKREFTSPAANRLITPVYHNGYTLPKY